MTRNHISRLSVALSASTLFLPIVCIPLRAQSRADSTAIMVALSGYLLASNPGSIAVRSGFDPHLMPAAARITPVSSLEGAAAKSMISVLLERGQDRVRTVPVPRQQREKAKSRRTESAYPTVFAIGGLAIGRDTAIILLTRTINQGPRPSTFTSGEYRRQFAKDTSGDWRLVSDELLTIIDGYYDFAPIENLPPAVRAEEQRRRNGPPSR